MRDDAVLLPWKEQLEAALHAAFGMLRSPTEHESNPLITSKQWPAEPLCALLAHGSTMQL